MPFYANLLLFPVTLFILCNVPVLVRYLCLPVLVMLLRESFDVSCKLLYFLGCFCRGQQFGRIPLHAVYKYLSAR